MSEAELGRELLKLCTGELRFIVANNLRENAVTSKDLCYSGFTFADRVEDRRRISGNRE